MDICQSCNSQTMAGCSLCPLSWFCILCEPNLFKKCYACNIYYCAKCNIELAYYKHIFKHITSGTNNQIHSQNQTQNQFQIQTQLIQSNQTQNQSNQSNQKQQKIFNPTKIRNWSVWKCNNCVQGY